MASWSFHSAGKLHIGRGALEKLPESIDHIPQHSRVLLITDENLVRAGLADRVIAALPDYAIEVYDKITPEPAEETIIDAVAAAKKFIPALIIGLGGGSNMDAAKLVSICSADGRQPSYYAGDCPRISSRRMLVCIPTTAGTGSEVSAAAVFTDAANKMKVSCLSPWIRPSVAIVDPSFTDNCPKQVTADSGIDALTHAIEAYTAVDHEEFVNRPPGGKTVYQGKNLLADSMAEQCIRLVGKNLKRVVIDGNDREARDGMALAATLGGLAFSNAGVALIHAMEYPVGGAVHVSHGAGNGLLLPFIMRFNQPVRTQAFNEIAEFLGVADAIAAVEQLRIDIGIPTRLRDLGVKEEQLPGFADRAFAIKRLMRVNPRLPSREDILAIYRSAF